MKVLLVAVPYDRLTDPTVAPPIGLLSLAAIVRCHGEDISVLDLNVAFEKPKLDECVNAILKHNADVIGISCMSPSYKWAKDLSLVLKNKTNSVLVIGGAHATALPEQTLRDTAFDIVVCGEAEDTIVELINNKFIPNSTIDGIAYRYGDKVVITKDRVLIKNLNILPMPARDLIDVNKYSRTVAGEKATNIITSRGCYGKCIYCFQDKMWHNMVRFFSAERVLGEIDWVRENWNIHRFLFLDDTLTVNRDRFIKICNGLKERKIVWRGWTRVNNVDKELLDIMKDSGCYMLCLGIEHFDNGMLKTMRKGTTAELNKRAIKLVKESGIICRVSVIVCAPGETDETIDVMKQGFLETRPDDWLLNVFVPLPGTEAFMNPDKFNMILDDDINYSNFFVVGNSMESGICMQYPGVSKDKILQIRNNMFSFLMKEIPPKCYTEKGIK